MYALFIFAQCGLPVALVLLIIGLCLRRPNPVLATNGKIHEELQALLVKE